MTEPTQQEARDPRYPIGRFRPPAEITEAQRNTWITQIERLPSELRRAAEGLREQQLDSQYRPGGWTLRQVVHHLADSHMNAYVRMRLALTEDLPLIKPYKEDVWAELPDAREGDVEISIRLLEALHERWAILLRAMSDEQYARRYRHPELGEMAMDRVLGLYAWHGRHHLAHITGPESSGNRSRQELSDGKITN
jgi:hypothetical protein